LGDSFGPGKQLLGIPWRVAFALQADGWKLRSDIIWAKPNPMPESVRDRPTKSHEYLFLLSKSPKYFYDCDAVREPAAESVIARSAYAVGGRKLDASRNDHDHGQRSRFGDYAAGRNRRSVWTVATQSFKGAHFATFPPNLIEPCVLAGTSARGCCPACAAPWVRLVERARWNVREEQRGMAKGNGHVGQQQRIHNTNGQTSGLISHTTGWRPTCACPAAEPVPCTILDPFAGACTTGLVAQRHGRDFIGIDVNAAYLEMGRKRVEADRQKQPLFAAS
jgi:hypothetical protein